MWGREFCGPIAYSQLQTIETKTQTSQATRPALHQNKKRYIHTCQPSKNFFLCNLRWVLAFMMYPVKPGTEFRMRFFVTLDLQCTNKIQRLPMIAYQMSVFSQKLIFGILLEDASQMECECDFKGSPHDFLVCAKCSYHICNRCAVANQYFTRQKNFKCPECA